MKGNEKFADDFQQAMTYYTKQSLMGDDVELQDAYDWRSAKVIISPSAPFFLRYFPVSLTCLVFHQRREAARRLRTAVRQGRFCWFCPLQSLPFPLPSVIWFHLCEGKILCIPLNMQVAASR